MYAHVKEDGSVDYLGSLPESWGNVSGLRLSNGDDEYLKTVGWLPIVETFVTPTYNQTFDPDIITVEEDRVTLVHRVRDMTSEEKIARDESHISNLRYERDEKLETSDWTHLSDHPAPLSDAKKTEWTTYRQALRDLPATADMLTWPNSFNWPTEPE
jgi:hypothetical protein